MIFRFKLIPKPVQSARFNPTAKRAFQSSKTVAYKASIREQAAQLMGDLAPFPAKVPLRVKRLEYIFPPLGGFSKKKLKQLEDGGIIYKSTKPDLMDNLNKGLFDALEGVVYYDDSSIVECCYMVKRYGLIPGIHLEIEVAEDVMV